ncbi:MAG TPA: hypothetical protein VFX87_05395 [Methylomirabilota bacterium]|nr:hypothetical protein [Methylomirabilota bacterium]
MGSLGTTPRPRQSSFTIVSRSMASDSAWRISGSFSGGTQTLTAST